MNSILAQHCVKLEFHFELKLLNLLNMKVK